MGTAVEREERGAHLRCELLLLLAETLEGGHDLRELGLGHLDESRLRYESGAQAKRGGGLM